MNTDYHDILAELIAQNARFLVVGAHALAAHGYPRATADIVQFGLAPNRIDLLTGVSGLEFAEAWKHRIELVAE